jgi:AcrR family transcriptional regulator
MIKRMSKKIITTRKRLIEVARNLFAERGKNGVTMNDIAEASKRGRRTLYTYFKSKDEIYKAVIDNELMKIFDKLQLVSEEKTEPDVKLRKHILTHLDAVKWAVTRNGSLRADFFRDIYEVERTRRKIDYKEIKLIGEILTEGVRKRIFKPLNIDLSAMMLLYSIKGLEVPYIRQNISRVFEKYKDSIVDIVFSGIKR